ncbi:ribosome silencing factor [Virgibacillus sp. W0181]|uniref:ribosome silencing factor n=1 Tax=Virgibacillus sp. W0181 TaxID=3391581 RepID=UPI003F44EA9E
MEITDIVQLIAEASDDRKAENIVALNMEELSSIADYFVICHGNNERQVQAIARSVQNALEKEDIRVYRLEGFEQARWVLVDTGDIVCHIFHKEERHYYNLERLWGDAARVELNIHGDQRLRNDLS